MSPTIAVGYGYAGETWICEENALLADSIQVHVIQSVDPIRQAKRPSAPFDQLFRILILAVSVPSGEAPIILQLNCPMAIAYKTNVSYRYYIKTVTKLLGVNIFIIERFTWWAVSHVVGVQTIQMIYMYVGLLLGWISFQPC